MFPIPLLKLANFYLDSKDGIKELAVLSYPIDKSDGTSDTVSYVNSLAILYSTGEVTLIGANMYGECCTGDREECILAKEHSISDVNHIWRADRAFVVETFDNKFFYIGCTAGLIGSTAAGGNDVCVTQWTALPSQITTTLGLDKHPERLLEVCGGMNNTCWVIGAPEGEGIWDIYGSGNNTYGSLHVDKNQHANPVKIAETSQDPVTGQWKNPALNLEVHDNSVIYGGPDGYWIAGYDFLRNNNQLNLVYPPVHGTWEALTGNNETYKWFMCGPNGAIVATERIHTDGSGLPVYVFYGQNSWGDKTWRPLNITYSHEVIIARGHATNGIFFNNGSKQYRGFSRNLCNDIGWSSAEANPRAQFQHKQAIATAAYVEQRTPVSWAENVYFQGINREGFLGTLTVVNGKLWWSGIPRGNFPGSNNLFLGSLNSQGFMEIPESWLTVIPVRNYESKIISVNGKQPGSYTYYMPGDTVEVEFEGGYGYEGATFFVDESTSETYLVKDGRGRLLDPKYFDFEIVNKFSAFGRKVRIRFTYKDYIGRSISLDVRVRSPGFNFGVTESNYRDYRYITHYENFYDVSPYIDGAWYGDTYDPAAEGRTRDWKKGDQLWVGLSSDLDLVPQWNVYPIRLVLSYDTGYTDIYKTNKNRLIKEERPELFQRLLDGQYTVSRRTKDGGLGGSSSVQYMSHSQELDGTAFAVHTSTAEWVSETKPPRGEANVPLVVTAMDECYFGFRWGIEFRYPNVEDQLVSYIAYYESDHTGSGMYHVKRTPRGVNVSVDLVKNGYGDIQAYVTAETTGNITFSFAAFQEDPRVVGAHDADWYITYTPQATEPEFLLGMKRDMQKKLGVLETCYVCIKDTRVKDTDPEAKWFTVDANTERSDRYINRYIACLGGTNLNLFWGENANGYSSFDYLRDVCATSWLNSNGWSPGECQIVPCVFTDNQTFLLKQANEVQEVKNGYDGSKWFYNAYAAFYWGTGELPTGGSCVEHTVTGDYYMGQVRSYQIIPGPETLGNAVDPYIIMATMYGNKDGAPSPMSIPVSSGYRRVVAIINSPLIGRQVPSEDGTSTHLFEVALHWQFSDEPFAGNKRMSDTDPDCKKYMLGGGYWWYEFDLTNKLTDSSKVITGLRLDLGENMHKSVCDGTYGSPWVRIKYIAFEHPEYAVYGKQLQYFRTWCNTDPDNYPRKTCGVVVNLGEEDMLVNAVWPNLDGTGVENAARSINWFNIHRAMWTTNCYIWRSLGDRSKGFSNEARMAPICWTSLMRCYDNQWEIGGTSWQEMRQSIVNHFADANGGGVFTLHSSRILYAESSDVYRVEGYSGSMIEWGYLVDTREVLAREIRDAVGPSLIQRQMPRWMNLPHWNKTAANTYSNTNADGDLFLYFDDMSQYTNWTPGNISLQVWNSAGSLVYTTTNAANDNCCVLPKAKLEECFGVARPDPVTLSMMVYDQTSGAFGPRVAQVYQNIEYVKPIQYMDVRTGCELSPDSNKKWWGMPNTSWIADEYILIYPKKALDGAIITANSAYSNLAEFVVRKDLAYDYHTPGDGTIPDADINLGAWCVPVEIRWTDETGKESAGTKLTAMVEAYDEISTLRDNMAGPYTKGALEISPRVTAKAGSVSIYGFSNSDSWALMDNNHTWAAGSSVTYEFLLKGFYSPTNAYQERGTYPYSQSGTQPGFYVTDNFLPGGAASLDFEVTSSDPTVFVATKLTDRKFAINAVKNGSAVITITATVSYGEGSYTFSKLYNWKCGSGTVITGLSDLPNPFNGIGIKGGSGVMRKPTLQPDGAVAASESWSTNNADAVTITSNTGQVKFVGVGTAVITYSCTDINGTVFTKTTTITVKELHPQYRAWVGNPTDGAYPQPYGTSNMESFSAQPCSYQTLVSYPMRVFGGMYIPELKGVPAGQLTIYAGDPSRLAKFGYSSPTVALSKSGWCGYELDWNHMENGKTFMSLSVAVQGISQTACRAGFNIKEA